MIRFIRTAAIAPGITLEAIGYAKEVAAYLETLGISTQVMVPVGGNPQRIGWLYECDDMTALDEAMQRMNGDPGYHAMAPRGGPLFIGGSFEDAIWRTI